MNCGILFIIFFMFSILENMKKNYRRSDFKQKVLNRATLMNIEYYSNLIKALKKELSKKRRQKLRNGPVYLLQDNAPPHRAAVTMETIENCGIELLRHPPYSPDLAPSDFFLFPEMKRNLKGRRFNYQAEIRQISEDWLLA